MRGHEPLLDMRRRGLVPTGGVYIDVTPAGDMWHRNWTRESLSIAFIDITPEDRIDVLDMRFLMGLDVYVCGESEERVGRVAAAAVKAGARNVIAAAGVWVSREHYTTTRIAFTNKEIEEWLEH